MSESIQDDTFCRAAVCFLCRGWDDPRSASLRAVIRWVLAVIRWVLEMPLESQPKVFFLVNGLLSAISDNVFVATIYNNEIQTAFDAGEISREHFETLAVSVNTGTNLPSVATPNGQAAFLFLLTSGIAPLIRLGYVRMILMAAPLRSGVNCRRFSLPVACALQ